MRDNLEEEGDSESIIKVDEWFKGKCSFPKMERL